MLPSNETELSKMPNSRDSMHVSRVIDPAQQYINDAHLLVVGLEKSFIRLLELEGGQLVAALFEA